MKLPISPSSRLPLTPLAAQHRLKRLDDDSRGWETAFAGELLWLAHRGVLRIHEVDDAGAVARITDAGYRPPGATGWEVEFLCDDPLLPTWSQALVDTYFPSGTRRPADRARVDRTGSDDPARRAALKTSVIAELDRHRVDTSARGTWVSRLLGSPYSRAFAGLLVVPIGLLLLAPLLPAWAVPVYLAALAVVVALTFVRSPLQRRWSKLWDRYREESQYLHELPLGERGAGPTRVVYLETFAENLGFADVVLYGLSEDVARGYAQQADIMVREGLLESIQPAWLVPQRQRVTPSELTDLVDGFLFTVR
ncbi:hypothetical protein [Pseudoclavibacter sp. AY1H1]|uniref:hypothetical protein n=1 Tax=Pseudoclavibacter sp. AY1H1 TaxID=2080584 RepID=UPI000CE76B8F|nr:hypothetical protein [Pseudoclavibacter sp. AY1H1]PPF33606.1 hypothetical protein C5E05_17375 [Pseudoclavibacter sp. AY1H1]